MQNASLTDKMSISVVMCTYNGQAFIEEQLLSILGQTYPLKEILIFDDASQDGTAVIIKKISDRYPVIKLHVNETNIGYTHNFEKALQATSGEAIAISDQDDIWAPKKIEKLVNAWEPGVPLIYCYSYSFTGTIPREPKKQALLRRFEGTDGRKLFMFNTVSGHAMVFKKELLKLIFPFSKNIYYDWWITVVASYNGGVQYLPEILVYQRLHGKNATFILDTYTKKQKSRIFKKEVIGNCFQLASIPNMPPSHRRTALQLAKLMKESLNRFFHLPLFLFLLKHQSLFLFHKKRKFSFFSYCKHSYRITKN